MLNCRKHNLSWAFIDGLIDNDEKVASNVENILISRLECKNHTLFKMARIDTLIPKLLKNRTLWGHTYLYIPYKGVPLPSPWYHATSLLGFHTEVFIRIFTWHKVLYCTVFTTNNISIFVELYHLKSQKWYFDDWIENIFSWNISTVVQVLSFRISTSNVASESNDYHFQFFFTSKVISIWLLAMIYLVVLK